MSYSCLITCLQRAGGWSARACLGALPRLRKRSARVFACLPIRDSGAARCNLGWCSSAPGVHPKYHAPRREAKRAACWADSSRRCAPPEAVLISRWCPPNTPRAPPLAPLCQGFGFFVIFEMVRASVTLAKNQLFEGRCPSGYWNKTAPATDGCPCGQPKAWAPLDS